MRTGTHMAVSEAALPLQERVPVKKNNIKRASQLVILFLLVALLCCRLSSLLRGHGGVSWRAAFLCESWFAFIWLLNMNAKWNPVKNITYPDRISKRFDDLPAVDMFVTTADPKLEPPLVTVNTVLSLLAVEYPAHKLACYVSDDGCSAVTYYALVEAAEFARSWVPFCKKYHVGVRAPSVYFSGEPETPHLPSTGFLQDWQVMKDKFEELERRIEEASRSHAPPHHVLKEEAAAYLSKFERGNHPSIVKVIWENEGGLAHGIPHLIYVSREKRPKHPHHYKAGAMNVLTRVSGVMTNAPFMVNVDCDMFVNNPDVVLHAMCLLIGFDDDRKSGFVQFPQLFYGGLKDDPFGNQLVVLQQFTVTTGLGGLQGPVYQGTGCFHRRKVIYGEAPADLIVKTHCRGAATLREDQIEGTVLPPSPQELRRRFGSSKELQESAAEILTIPSTTSTAPSKTTAGIKGGLMTATEAAAKQVASCTYELNTCWGKEVGWVYGSLTEDIQTGLRIHSLGWKTVALDTNPPAFLGSAPVGGPASMTQYKRWCTGLLETLVGRNRTLLAAALMTKNNLSFRQCLVYLFVSTWGLRSVPELCYALLAPFCVFSNTSFLPKVREEH